VKPPHPATSAAIITLTTLLLAGVAYGATSGVLHRQGAAFRPMGTASASPSPLPSAAPSLSPSSIPKPVPPSSLPTPGSPAGLAVIGVEFVDQAHGWVLLSSCTVPGGPPCHYATASTTDGGATWSHPVPVGPLYDATDGGAPRSIRFVNIQDGFVYGGTGAFVTHDSGRSWTALSFKATYVADIVIGGGRVWALAYPCAKGTLCAYELRSSPDGGRTWSAPHTLPLNFSPDMPDAFPSGLILSNVPLGEIQLTVDGGATWQAIKSPCTSNPFRAEASTPDGRELWDVCTPYPGAADAFGHQTLFVSEDAGQSWSLRVAFPEPGTWQVVSSRPHLAFTSTNGQTFVSHDSGMTWSAVPSQTVVFTTIRFASAQWGWALDNVGNLWTTPDGGDTWLEAGAIPNTLS
jgi:photosystem II stability/assembly factor-like uncharacterized protein